MRPAGTDGFPARLPLAGCVGQPMGGEPDGRRARERVSQPAGGLACMASQAAIHRARTIVADPASSWKKLAPLAARFALNWAR